MIEMEHEGLDCSLKIEKEVLTIQFWKDNRIARQFTLKAGYKRISDTFFKQNIPTEAEIDSAINFIEDDLMSDRELLGRKGYLFTSGKKLVGIFHKNGLNEHTYSRQNVESLFAQYARVMMGAPSSELNAEITREDVAILLVLREVMHHLDFEELRISG